MDWFETLVEPYQEVAGKKNSLYIYVLFNCPKSKITEHISSQIKNLDKVSDGFKRKLYTQRYYTFRQYLQDEIFKGESDGKNEPKITQLFFVGDTITHHPLPPNITSLLRKYGCPSIRFRYGDKFELAWLKDYLLNDQPFHVVCLQHYHLSYWQMTRSKKRLMAEYSDKQTELSSFLQQHVSPHSCVLYGTGPRWSAFSQTSGVSHVVPGMLNEEELSYLVDRMAQEKKIERLQKDLDLLKSQNTCHRLKFKQDLPEALQSGLMARLYLNCHKIAKFRENCEKYGLALPGEIISLDPALPSFQSGNEKILEKYGDVVGVCYY